MDTSVGFSKLLVRYRVLILNLSFIVCGLWCLLSFMKALFLFNHNRRGYCVKEASVLETSNTSSISVCVSLVV